MRSILLAAAVVVLAAVAPSACAQRAVYLLRHAEPLDDGTDGLNERGREHARVLVRMLKDAKIKAIYTSDLKRTQETAKPLADSLGLTATIMPANDPSQTVTKIKADHPNDVVLIVGHSNTVPAMIKLWDGSLAVTIDDRSEFDRIFLLVPTDDGKAGLGQLRYHKAD